MARGQGPGKRGRDTSPKRERGIYRWGRGHRRFPPGFASGYTRAGTLRPAGVAIQTALLFLLAGPAILGDEHLDVPADGVVGEGNVLKRSPNQQLPNRAGVRKLFAAKTIDRAEEQVLDVFRGFHDADLRNEACRIVPPKM